ncbi:MAG: hypothetical protein CM15mP128_3510 [Methanobacteriota archaeon]|nr:MAG: hypothetical protein CM15mP128_3510 [Euryarchaeota archaeon]
MQAILEALGPRRIWRTRRADGRPGLAVEALEDEPGFNAGVGSVLDANGQVSMDASIMRGEDGAAGSVVGVPTFDTQFAWRTTCSSEDGPS